MTVMAISGQEAVAWVAAVTAAIALGNQTISAIRKRRKEHDEIEEALDHAPQVRHELELGNVGAAVGHLNVIMESQAKYIHEQDGRIAGLVKQIRHLEERNQALEAESEGWEAKYDDEVKSRLRDKKEADRKIEALEKELDELRRSTARTLAQMRRELDAGEPGEET